MRKKKNKNTDNPPHYNRNINIIRGIFFCLVALAFGLYLRKDMLALFSPPTIGVKVSEHGAPEKIFASNSKIQKNIGIDEGLELMLKNDCITCHKDNTPVIGPTFADIAAKYKNDESALKSLSEKVKLGIGGVWGALPMKPHGDLNSIDIEKMVKFILSLEGGKAPDPLPLSEILEIK